MPEQPNPFETIELHGAAKKAAAAEQAEAKEREEAALVLGSLVQQDQYLGETLKMDFRNVTVQVHDHHRRQVGGIPHLSYLIASRIQPWKDPLNWIDEDSSVLLLRVIGAAPTPSELMDTIVRAEAARRATGAGSDSVHWDAKEIMDGYTRHALSFAGLQCEVIGTFYLGKENDNATSPFELRFGTDINNFYPNRGLKVYKPVGEALKTIVNFRDPSLTPDHALSNFTVPIGHVRYASTNRPMQGVDDVDVWIAPVDLLAQRTALFGMSRTGKSNTTKIIARSIYNLRRSPTSPIKVGQIIFDYNGEYANENTQGSADIVANALKNVWREQPGAPNEVKTYGLSIPAHDPTRLRLQINAFGVHPRDWSDAIKTAEDLDMLMVGKAILDDLNSADTAKYIKNFGEVDLSVPDNISDRSKQTRYKRLILVYLALLVKAGLTPPPSLRMPINLIGRTSLFGADLINAMNTSPDVDNVAEYQAAATALDFGSLATLTWDRLASALEGLEHFIKDGANSGYNIFNTTIYMPSSSTGEPWADPNILRVLEMFRYPNGARSVARLAPYHEPNNTRDFAKQIYDDLIKGFLVIVDQAGGDPAFNDAAARRIMWAIFKGNQHTFVTGGTPTDILVYVEEAHNLLPPSKADDLKDVWVRTAKEGSKYRIGLIYATQEVSSIQKNILKNTANWLIAHLNNTDETKELKKFYDFANFEDSILRAQNRGFLRVKMLSNPYINPIQVLRFRLDIPTP